jgi:hypothetical protein
MGALSAAMRDVLRACRAQRDGVAGVADLVAARQRRGVSLPVARASLSRTLRRLWQAGLVELSNAPYRPTSGDGRFRQPRTQARDYLKMAESRAAYDRVRKARQAVTPESVPASFDAYRAEYLARASRPEVRAQWVRLTAAGKQLTRSQALGVNPKPASRKEAP